METNEKLMSAIFNVARLIREEILQNNCSADFTQSEIEVLKFAHANKNITMKEVADYLHIKPASATFVINNLVKKGSLKRIESKRDRRVVHVFLTSRGLKSLQKKYKTIHKTIAKVFKQLNEKDKKILIKIFNKINANNK